VIMSEGWQDAERGLRGAPAGGSGKNSGVSPGGGQCQGFAGGALANPAGVLDLAPPASLDDGVGSVSFLGAIGVDAYSASVPVVAPPILGGSTYTIATVESILCNDPDPGGSVANTENVVSNAQLGVEAWAVNQAVMRTGLH
jgi:hypothetical protein